MDTDKLDQTIPSLGPLLETIENPGNLGPNEYVILHEDGDNPVDASRLQGRYVSGMVHLERPPETVAECLTDFDRQQEFIRLYGDVSTLESNANRHRVHYRAQVEMALLTLDAEFDLVYEQRNEHEWIWFCDGGDLTTYQGRIELIPTAKGTLLGITAWIDLSGVSWLLDTVLWAQPDLHVALPVTMTGILLNGFHRELSDSPMNAPEAASATSPSPPRLASGPSPEVLRPFLECGTVLLFHPRELVNTSDGSHEVLFTTGLRRIRGSRDRVRDALSDFESYPTFVDQIDRVESHPMDEGFRSEWFFKLGLGLLSIPISFTIDYRWNSDTELYFEMTEGHFDLIAGRLEWYELDDDETVYAITSGSYIGEDAPRLVRLANAIPYREIFMGATLSTVLLQKSRLPMET